MKKLVTILTAALVLMTGCRTTVLHPDLIPPSPPTGLSTSTGDNLIEIFWNANPEPDVEGYNVLVSPALNGPYRLIGSTRVPHFVDQGATNGNTYYYAVTAFDFDGNESELSRDVAYDIPRPEGYDVILYDYAAQPDYAGYDFSAYSVVSFDGNSTDMYFENYNGTLYMNVYKDTDIQDMGPTSSILDVSQAPASGWSTTHDAILRAGHTYVVWTHDDHYAKFRVTGLSAGRVVFDWAYQLQKSNPLLKRPATTGDRNAITHEVHGHGSPSQRDGLRGETGR